MKCPVRTLTEAGAILVEELFERLLNRRSGRRATSSGGWGHGWTDAARKAAAAKRRRRKKPDEKGPSRRRRKVIGQEPSHSRGKRLDQLQRTRRLKNSGVQILRASEVAKVLPRPSKDVGEKHLAFLKEHEHRLSLGDRRAIKMFSFGYDSTIRAIQRGESSESLVAKHKEHFKGAKDKRGDSAEEHVRKAGLAAKQMDSVFKNSPPAPIKEVYRGIVVPKEVADKFLSQKTFDMRGMTSSTSWDPVIARSFVSRYRSDEPGSEYGIMLKIRHKTGVGIEHVSDVPVEKEILLRGDTRFKIKKRYKMEGDSKYLVIEAEEISGSVSEQAEPIVEVTSEAADTDETLDQSVRVHRFGSSGGGEINFGDEKPKRKAQRRH